MSKKKSLGSSPIGFQSNRSSMRFIPDLGVSKSKSTAVESYQSDTNNFNEQASNSSHENSTKKIVSYNLEISLINKVKSLADQKEMYYSSLVSTALKSWIAKHS